MVKGLKIFIGALAGLILSLGLLEIGMRTLGRGLLAAQESGNTVKPEDSRKVRIVTLGESTSADVFSEDELQHAWPRRLEENLAARGINARVYNLARPATNTSAILRRLPEQLDYFNPHIVVSMMGINDRNTLIVHHPSWWDELRVVKLFKTILHLRRRPDQIPLKKFDDPESRKVSARILDPEAMTLIERRAQELEPVERAQFYFFSAETLNKASAQPHMDEVMKLLLQSLKAKFQGGPVLISAADLLSTLGRDEECLELAKKFIGRGWIADDAVLFHFTLCARSSSRKNSKIKNEWPAILAELGAVGEFREGTDLTAQNHRAVHRLLTERKILHVEMQYPTQPIERLKEQLGEEGESVLFVENKNTFE
ncbi:MAG: SGNH/GDSL hydrolase family protein, partial [Bdellovibrionia bacterium]